MGQTRDHQVPLFILWSKERGGAVASLGQRVSGAVVLLWGKWDTLAEQRSGNMVRRHRLLHAGHKLNVNGLDQ